MADDKEVRVAEVSDSDDSDDEEEEALEATGPIAMSGYCELGPKKKLKPLYCCLAGSSLFYYKNELDHNPNGCVELNGGSATSGTAVADADSDDEKDDKKEDKKEDKKKDKKKDDKKKDDKKKDSKPVMFEIIVKSSKDKDKPVYIHFNKETKRDAWLKALQESLSLPAHPAPEKEQFKKKKKSFMYKAKKGMGSKIVGSSIGAKGVNQVLDDNTKKLIKCLKNLVEADSGKQKAEDVEKGVVRIVWKCFCEWDRKTVSGDEFLKIDPPLRAAFKHIDKIFGIWGWTPDEPYLEKEFGKIEQQFTNAGQTLSGLIKPYIHPKNIVLIQDLFEYLGSTKFLMHMWNNRENEVIKNAIFDLMLAMRMYLNQEVEITQY